MTSIIVAILLGLLILGLVWFFVARNPNNPWGNFFGGNSNPSKPLKPLIGGNLIGKSRPVGDLSVVKAFQDFSDGLFDRSNGGSCDMGPINERLVKSLCSSNTNHAITTLNEYTEKLCEVVKNHKSNRKCADTLPDSDDHTPTDTGHLDEVRHLANALNTIFSACVKRNDKSFGMFFGILASNILAYKLALNRGQKDRAAAIRQRMTDYIQKLGN